MPIKNNTNVVVHEKVDEGVLRHAVEYLDDPTQQLNENELRILQKKIIGKLQTKSQHDEYKEEQINGAHPCQRECKEGEERMICYYHFSIEWYQTMSKACYNCPYIESDCFRKDCIPADGINRPLNVVNRKMPGPSIEVRTCYCKSKNLRFAFFKQDI